MALAGRLPTLYTLNRWNNNRTDIYGLFLRHQTAAWKGRLIGVAGVRYDLVREDLRRETEARLGTGPVSVLKRDQDHFTPNAGVNFEVAKASARTSTMRSRSSSTRRPTRRRLRAARSTR